MRSALGRPGRRLHTSAVAVAVVTLLGTVGATGAGLRVVDDNDRRLLRQDTGQAAMVLAAYLAQWQGQLGALGAAVRVNAHSAAALARAAESTRAAGQYAGLAVLRADAEGRPVVVTAAGRLALDPVREPVVGQLRGLVRAGGSRAVGFSGHGLLRRFGTAVGAPVLPRGWAVYVESMLPENMALPPLPGLAFSDVDIVVYVGREAADSVLFGTTKQAVLSGRVARAVLGASGTVASVRLDRSAAASPGDLLLAVRAKRHLSGAATALFPWALLVAGTFAAIAFTVLLETALRRRDDAIGLVRGLEETNAALDLALARQAEAEAELRQAQRLEAVGQLAGGIAHDFNNLLAVILASAAFVADEVGDGPVGEDVAEIRSAAKTAADLTRQLLIFSRRDVVEPVVVDVEGVVAETDRLLRRTLGEDVELVWQRSGVACPVLSDRGELEQVLMNLAVNARDAMPIGGRLTITTGLVDVHPGDVPVPPGRYVRLLVTDTGTGMSTHVMARAFEPFFTTKETGRGTGLGLATVYGIATRWGGHVSLRSEPGNGTTVTLLLPASTEPVTRRDTEPPAAAAEPPPAATVLLVEDEPAVRRIGRRVLERGGHRVVEAATAVEALEVFASVAPDVVVTDVVMPGGMTGQELADRLFALDPRLPVVFVSGYSTDVLAERGMLATGVALVHKPYAPEALLAAVRTALTDRVGVLR